MGLYPTLAFNISFATMLKKVKDRGRYNLPFCSQKEGAGERESWTCPFQGETTQMSIPTQRRHAHSPCRVCTSTSRKIKRDLGPNSIVGNKGLAEYALLLDSGVGPSPTTYCVFFPPFGRMSIHVSPPSAFRGHCPTHHTAQNRTGRTTFPTPFFYLFLRPGDWSPAPRLFRPA